MAYQPIAECPDRLTALLLYGASEEYWKQCVEIQKKYNKEIEGIIARLKDTLGEQDDKTS